MTLRRQNQRIGLITLTLVLTISCTPAYNQKFGMSFLPASPRQAAPAQLATDAPKVEANLFLSETRSLLQANIPVAPRPTQTDGRIRRAEERFHEGKRLFLAGDHDAARTEFDQAIDILLNAPEAAADRHKIERKLEELVSAIHKYDVNGLGAGDMSAQQAYDKAPLEDILEMTFPIDPNLTPRVKDQLLATQSQLPLQVTDAVLSYINYFSSDRGHKTLVAGLRRSGRYKPLITKILAEEKVPQELIYLAQAESGFLPRAVSHKAAVGMWQFVQWRGRQYGLVQTSFHDDRMDPEKATRSAARHLRDLYEKFGDWYLAIAAYNCGDGCVEKAVQRTGYADFWEIRNRNAIPKETTNYVPIIVAMTIMHKNAKDYGLEGVELEAPLSFDTVELDAPAHVGLIADAADRPVSEIRDLNPALLSNVAPAGYGVHVPQGTKEMVLGSLASVPAEKRASWRIHRVAAGDTFESIAKRYQTPASSIATVNNSSDAEIGDVLIIPTASQLERFHSTGRKLGKKVISVRRSSSSVARAGKAGVKAAQSVRRTASGRLTHRRGRGGAVQTAGLR